MKKITIFILFFTFLSVNFAFAGGAEAVSSDNETKNAQVEKTFVVEENTIIFDIVKTKIATKSKKFNDIFDEMSEKIKNAPQSMRTAIILIVVGLIFLLLAGATGWGSIVYAVGAIFFLIGALLLLLELL